MTLYPRIHRATILLQYSFFLERDKITKEITDFSQIKLLLVFCKSKPFHSERKNIFVLVR